MAVKNKKRAGSKSLNKRYQQSYASKDQGGGGSGVFRWRELDQDVKFFQPSNGRNRINIIPYPIKGKSHPLVRKGEFEIGDLDYVMDIHTHRMVGPSESTVLCLKKTFGKPCPICEEAEKLKKAGKEKEAGALKPSRRCFYNVEDLKNHPGEIMVFEVSHFLFEKELIDEARGDDSDDGFIEFADPDNGKEIKFRVQKISRGGFEFNEFKSFSFDDREEALDDELLSQAISFDAIMTIPTYEEAQAILYGADDDESDDEDDTEDEDDEDEKSSKKKSSAPEKKKPAKKPEPEVDEDEDDSDDEEDDDEEDEKPAPKKSSKPAAKPSKKKLADDEDEEDEEDDDEEDEKPSKPSKPKAGAEKGSGGKCPFGHKFGKDCDQHDDCDDCDKWDTCVNAK